MKAGDGPLLHRQLCDELPTTVWAAAGCRYNTFNVQAGTLFCDAAYQREARPSLPVKTLHPKP